jgi:SAM-dependent methyltransferase
MTTYGNLCSQFYDATEGYASEKEVDFYAAFIEKNPGRVLEAMSGSGRLQIPLLKRGYVVDGVDASSHMLARCRERCAALNLTPPELYEQSLENLNLPHQYATVTIAVGSFQLIHERDQAVKAFKNIRAHMSAKGNLLVDTFVPKVGADPVSVRAARLDSRTTIRLTTRQILDEHSHHADAVCTYELIVDGAVQQVEQELVRVVWYTDQELEQLFNEAGFNIVHIYEEKFYDAGLSRIVHAQPA